MLETPTRGRYLKEEKFLVFEADNLYLGLVYACIGGGAVGVLYGLFEGSSWFVFTFLAVCLAGIWANLSLIRIRFDFKTKMYRRRQGPGFIPKLWQGSISDLDALQVVASPSLVTPGAVNYHLILHWKERRAPLMVLETETRVPYGGSIQSGAQPLLARAMKFGSSLGIPVYDNTQQLGVCPVPIWN